MYFIAIVHRYDDGAVAGLRNTHHGGDQPQAESGGEELGHVQMHALC
jgi:hypothetical protein